MNIDRAVMSFAGVVMVLLGLALAWLLSPY